MLEEYTNAPNQGPNRNPPGRLLAYNWHSGDIQTAYKPSRPTPFVTDALSTMLRLLREESAEASWLIQARSRMDPVEPCDEEW